MNSNPNPNNSKTTEQLEEEIKFLHERIDNLEKDMQSVVNGPLDSKKFDDSYILSDNESSSFLNESFPHRTRSGKLTNVTDIAYLYSVPLTREENGKILTMGLPIDHNAEIDDIVEGLEATNKMVNFRMETATIDSLQNIFMIKPKIVHLSCHGDFDNKANTYYLAFESKKSLGMMEKLTMNRLKKLFENQINLKSIEAMVVSACHSQKIGELMMDSGIPIVICINAPFKVQDEAARSFGKVFHSALVQGMTYQDAFTSAQNFIAAHQEANKIYSCCCAHPHKDDCTWSEKAKEIGHLKAHELHMATCKCNLHGNLHYYADKRLCTFADEFLEEFATWGYYDVNENYPECTNLC